jgi:hypothetical protein
MDFDEANKELDTVRNNGSDYVKAMNDAEWRRILGELLPEGYPESPEGALEPPPGERRSLYHDYGVKPPASPIKPQGPSIFVSPWIYHEILSVLADIDRFERSKKTRWARLRKIDKMRRKLPVVKASAIYTTYTRATSMPQYPYITWIS